MSADGEPKRSKEEQQHGLTNGHVTRDERRGSSEGHGKSQSESNKENAQGQNVKEDSPEKKKKKKRRKKKGGGGGNAVSGNGNGSGPNGETGEGKVKNSPEGELASGKSSLTHTSSEEHSDGAGSTLSENQTSSQEPGDMSAHDSSTAVSAAERESIDSSIDPSQPINIDSTCINVAANSTHQAGNLEAPMHAEEGSVSNATCTSLIQGCEEGSVTVNGGEGISNGVSHLDQAVGVSLNGGEGASSEDSSLVQNESLPLDGEEGVISEHSSLVKSSHQEMNSENIGSSVDDPIHGTVCCEDIDLFISEDSDPSRNTLEVETAPRSEDSTENHLASALSYLASATRNLGLDAPPEQPCNLISGPDVKESNDPRGDLEEINSHQVRTETYHGLTNGFKNEADDLEDNENANPPSPTREDSIMRSETSSSTRPKRDISIVDLLGARATAGSAIRAGIIQDMMGNSGASGQLADNACVDVAADVDNEVS